MALLLWPLARRSDRAEGVAHSPPMPTALSTPAQGYVPRCATNDLKDIIEDWLEELVRVYDDKFLSSYGPFHPRVKELLERYVRCGDPHFGFLRLRCINPECTCKGELIVPFS